MHISSFFDLELRLERSMNPTHILAVCTGNICRSPAIERLLAYRLAGSAAVASAGTMAVVGAPIAEPMAQLLIGVGVSPAGFAARRINQRMIDESDLILTASTEHRSAVVALQPLAMKKTFTLLEFARTVPHVSAAVAHLPLAQRVPALAQQTYQARPHLRFSREQIDIPDPFGNAQEVYVTAFTLITHAVNDIAPILM